MASFFFQENLRLSEYNQLDCNWHAILRILISSPNIVPPAHCYIKAPTNLSVNNSISCISSGRDTNIIMAFPDNKQTCQEKIILLFKHLFKFNVQYAYEIFPGK